MARSCAVLVAVALNLFLGSIGAGELDAVPVSARVQRAAPAVEVRVTGSVESPFVRPGQVEILKARLWSNRALGQVIVDFVVRDFRGARVYERARVVSLKVGLSPIVPQKYVPASNSFAGTYSLALGVFGPSWKPMYVWDESSASFDVRGATLPHFKARGQVTPATVYPGASVKLTDEISLHGPAVHDLTADFEIYRGSTKIYQTYRAGLHIAPFGTRRVTVTWRVPRTLRPGTYVMNLGLFGSSWSKLYLYKPGAAVLVVR